MKKFYWKALIDKMGMRNFIEFLIAVIVTIIATAILFKKYGLDIVIESFVLSYLFDKYKEFHKAICELNEKYTIKK